MLRFATIFRIMKMSKYLNNSEEYFKVITKEDSSEEKYFYYKKNKNHNIEFNRLYKLINDIDNEYIFKSINIKNKSISLKNVLSGKVLYIYPDQPSDDDLIEDSLTQKIEDLVSEE